MCAARAFGQVLEDAAGLQRDRYTPAACSHTLPPPGPHAASAFPVFVTYDISKSLKNLLAMLL